MWNSKLIVCVASIKLINLIEIIIAQNISNFYMLWNRIIYIYSFGQIKNEKKERKKETWANFFCHLIGSLHWKVFTFLCAIICYGRHHIIPYNTTLTHAHIFHLSNAKSERFQIATLQKNFCWNFLWFCFICMMSRLFCQFW